jgi:hypothetical protein
LKNFARAGYDVCNLTGSESITTDPVNLSDYRLGQPQIMLVTEAGGENLAFISSRQFVL